MYLKSAISIIILIFAAFIIGLISYTTVYYSPHIASAEKLVNYKDTGIVLTDRNNEHFYSINEGDVDEYITLDNISDHLEKAVISAEDEEFYDHSGVSIRGIIRSIALNIQAQSLSYGGSTLSQQLVKNSLLTPEKTFTRKFQEAILAINLEGNYSKEEILEMYLNSVYYGEGAVGIEDAAETYFDKEPSEITLSEGAYLAGILRSPGLLSPYSIDSERAENIKETTLSKMRSDNVISDSEYEKAMKERLAFSQRSDSDEFIAPHFALMIEEELKRKYGEDVIYDGLTVKTTLDLNWQRVAQQHVDEFLGNRFGDSDTNGAAVVMDPNTGEILVLVGSRDWFNNQYGKFNMATSPRQPGSTFKPIVYSLALENNTITPATILTDRKTTFGDDYTPENYDRRYRGKVTVRQALANSLNIPSVQVMEQVGVRTVVSRSDDFGISTLEDPSNYGPSLVLGSGEVSLVEMVNAYTTFANNGVRYDPVMILEIKDKYGNVIYEKNSRTQKVMDEETAYLITSILSDESARRATFGDTLSMPFPTAVKTGTTENFRDAWTIGYTNDLTVGVWVGHNDNRPMYNAPGSSAAAPIWKNIMQDLMTQHNISEFSIPDGIVEARFCIPGSSSSARLEYFKRGTEPDRQCVPNIITTASNSNGGNDNEDEAAPPPDMPNIGGVEGPPEFMQAENKEKEDKKDNSKKENGESSD